MNQLSLAFVALLVFAQPAEAFLNNLGGPSPAWDRAATLSYDQSLISFQTSMARSTSEFDREGSSVELGQHYSQSSTWGEVLGRLGQESDKLRVQGFLKANGLKETDIAETTEVKLEVERLEVAPFMAYGLTEDWSLALHVPLHVIRNRVSLSSKASTSMKSFVQQSVSKGEKVPDVLSKSQMDKSLEANNYNHMETESQELQLGDIEIHSKHQILRTENFAFSFAEILRFASAQPQPLDEFIDVSGDDSQMDVGVGAYLDWMASSRLMFLGYVGYLAQLEDTRAMRVPRSGNNSINTDEDMGVTRNLGDITEARLAAEFDWTLSWKLFTQYIFAKKSRDQYRGDQFEKSRYQLMADGSEGEAQIARLGVRYSSVTKSRSILGRNKGFQINILASSTVAGKNIPSEPARFNMGMLFYF